MGEQHCGERQNMDVLAGPRAKQEAGRNVSGWAAAEQRRQTRVAGQRSATVRVTPLLRAPATRWASARRTNGPVRRRTLQPPSQKRRTKEGSFEPSSTHRYKFRPSSIGANSWSSKSCESPAGGNLKSITF